MPDISLIKKLADLALDHGIHEDAIVDLIRKVVVSELPPKYPIANLDPTPGELETLKCKDKIHAIKAYRQRTGAGLKESKDMLEDWGARLGILIYRDGRLCSPADIDASNKF